MPRTLLLLLWATVACGCAWDHPEPCPIYGEWWCDGDRVMTCDEASGFLSEDEVRQVWDCREMGGVCLEPRNRNATCVLPDGHCEGTFGCHEEGIVWCIEGRLSARPGTQCEHGCESVTGLDGEVACVEPAECTRAGEITCVEPAPRPSGTAVYRVCQRPGWIAELRCTPRPNIGNFDACADPLLQVPCWTEPPVTEEDAGADDDAGAGG
jgi:hypothetical protein